MTQMSHSLGCGNRISVVMEEFLLGTPRCSWSSSETKFPLGKNGMKMTDESSVTEEVSGKIYFVRAPENAGDGDRGGGERVRRGRRRYYL